VPDRCEHRIKHKARVLAFGFGGHKSEFEVMTKVRVDCSIGG